MSIANVNDITPRNQVVASASQTVFTYTFPLFDEDDAVVYSDTSLMVLGVDYTVTGVGADAGGTIVFATGRDADTVVTITRDTPLTRTADYATNGGLSTTGINDDFDRLVLMVQDAHHRVDRSVQRVITDSDAAIEWDLDGGRATNAADAEEDQDLVTLAQLNGVIAGTLLPGSVTLNMLEDIPDQRVLGNVSGGADAPVALTQAQVRTFLGQSANGTSIVTAANFAAMRTLLDLEVGTDFYSIAAVDAAIAAAVVGLADYKGNQDCSSNPNYPAASKGDLYRVSVAGRIGGGSGIVVSVGDFFFALADNAGGTQAGVGSSWEVWEGNIPGLTAAGIALIDDPNAAAQRVTLGLADDKLEFLIDGGGSVITTGAKGVLHVPYDCTINLGVLLGDQSGSIVVDVWKDTYANYPPTDADSITASAPLTISGATNSSDAVLTGWTLSLLKGDVLRYNVDSVTSLTWCLVSLGVTV